MRTRTPFIEAFRKQQAGENPSLAVPTAIHERDISPKSPKESFTRVVSGHVLIIVVDPSSQLPFHGDDYRASGQ